MTLNMLLLFLLVAIIKFAICWYRDSKSYIYNNTSTKRILLFVVATILIIVFSFMSRDNYSASFAKKEMLKKSIEILDIDYPIITALIEYDLFPVEIAELSIRAGFILDTTQTSAQIFSAANDGLTDELISILDEKKAYLNNVMYVEDYARYADCLLKAIDIVYGKGSTTELSSTLSPIYELTNLTLNNTFVIFSDFVVLSFASVVNFWLTLLRRRIQYGKEY